MEAGDFLQHRCIQMRRLWILIPLLVSILPSAAALHVVPGSNCTAVCTQNVTASGTSASDITCNDQDYNVTDVGTNFRDCVSCELRSRTFDHQTAQTDLGWALYNMRYAVDTCVYGFPESIKSAGDRPCQQSCANITKVMEMNIPEANTSTPYDYCHDNTFVSNVGACASCYSVVPNQVYISNFLNTLKVACVTKPSTTTTFTVEPDDVFATNPPSTFPTKMPNQESSDGLPHGAVVAIGICVPVFFFLVLTLVFLYCYLKIQNRSSKKKPSHRNARFSKEKSVVEPYHGWHQNSAARIRPVSYVAPLRTRYSNPLAQIAEAPSRSGSQSDATATEGLVSKPLTRSVPPPAGLVAWERRGVEDAAKRDTMLSDSMKSIHQASGSTTIIPSDGRRDSGESSEDEEQRQKSVLSMSPPPLFSIPETGSSTTFVPARSGTPWGGGSIEPRRSTSRNSRRSEGPQRSSSRRSQRSQEARRSTSRQSDSATSREPPRENVHDEPRSSEAGGEEIPSPLEEPKACDGLGMFREVSYSPKPND